MAEKSMKKVKLSMRWTLILCALVLVWGTHLLLTPSFYLLSEKIFLNHARDIMENISDLTLEQSHNHLNKARSAAHLAKLLLSSHVLNEDGKSAESMERYFFEQLSIYPHLAGIYFAAPNGDFFYVSHNEERIQQGFRTKIIRETAGNRKTELIWRDDVFAEIDRQAGLAAEYDPRTRPWYKKALQEKKITWTSPYIFFTSRRPGVTIAGPLYEKSGAFRGVVGVDIDIDELSQFISKLRVGKSGRAFMLNSNGDVIAYGGLQDFIVKDKISSKLRLPKVDEIDNPVILDAFSALHLTYDEQSGLRINEPKFTSFETAGESYVTMFTPFPGEKLPWIVGMYFPEDDYLRSIRDNRRYNLLATIVISLLATVFVFRFSGVIIRPIVNLAREARAIEENDLKISFDAGSIFSEIQAAADSFSRMKQSIIDYRSEIMEKEAMYRAITSTVSDAILLVNEQHQIVYLNPEAEKIFGCSLQDAVRKNVHDVTGISWNSSDLPSSPTGQGSDGDQSSGGRMVVEVYTRHAGSRFLEVSLAALEIDRHPHVVLVVRDSSDRIKAEKIKKQLVRDLHDGVGGNLANMKILAQMENSAEPSSPAGRALTSIAELCEDSMLEIRSYMDRLEEKQTSWENLVADLRQYCAGAVEVNGISFIMDVDINNPCCQPSPLLSLNMYRIIKEGITNIIKHSQSSRVILTIGVNRDELVCQLQDDGMGLAGRTRNGRGILNMKSRTVQLGGRFSLEEDQGVIISIRIPLVRELADL